ncbi:MAG: glycosyltransferase family 2 protein [Candidatus Krumholzibacteriia bacterium]
MILSVVIPTRDKAALLARTVAALRAQRLDEPWEIVVVDDASSDGTPALLAAAAAEQPEGRLRVVTCARNVGRAGARNLGWRAAAGRWVLFLDDDIVAPPGLLAAHLARLRARDGCGTIGRVVTDPPVVDGALFHYLDSRGVAKVGGGEVPARYFVTQNAAVPRAALAAVAGFDERFRAWGLEDMELAFRLEDRLGMRFLAVTAPTPVHVHHHTVTAWVAKKRECGAVSLPLLATLHPGRLREMRLHWVIDGAAAPARSVPARLLRAAARGPLLSLLTRCAGSWPTRGGHRPIAPWLHARLLDLLVLLAYCQGLRPGTRQT